MNPTHIADRENVTPAAPPAGNVAGATHRIWLDHPESFSTQQTQTLRHNFDQHPLMQLPELAKLAKSLAPTKQCRFIAPGANLATPFEHADNDPIGRSIDELFTRIEEPGAWIALYNVETNPVYREFLAEVTQQVRPLVDREEPGMYNVGGFIFISAPPSVTPFHIDREHNFWLQVRGRKTMRVWDRHDPDIVTRRDVDEFIVHGTLEGVKLRQGQVERSQVFEVGAGDGVYFPSTSPHATECDASWTRPGDGVSVSIGVVFYTPRTRFIANVHAANLLLRKLGGSPMPPGQSGWRDALKYPLGRGFITMKRVLRGTHPKPGF